MKEPLRNNEGSHNPFRFSRRTIHDPRDGEIETHLEHINREFREGFEFLKRYPKSVSFFGSSLAAPGGPMYRHAEGLAGKIVHELGYAVIAGGGPGIMEAANKGAAEAGGQSVGLTISLPHERTTNPYANDTIRFSYFFSRKTMLTFSAEAFIFFPGGFGTFDELFSILTLVQTGKIPRVPIILFGADYWNPFKEFIRAHMYEAYHAIDGPDLELFTITDSEDAVVEIVRKAPISEWWKNIN